MCKTMSAKKHFLCKYSQVKKCHTTVVSPTETEGWRDMAYYETQRKGGGLKEVRFIECITLNSLFRSYCCGSYIDVPNSS